MLLPLHLNLGGGTTFFQTISANVTGTASITTKLGYSQTISASVTGTASIAEVFIAGTGPVARWFTKMAARLLGYRFHGKPGGKFNRRNRD